MPGKRDFLSRRSPDGEKAIAWKEFHFTFGRKQVIWLWIISLALILGRFIYPQNAIFTTISAIIDVVLTIHVAVMIWGKEVSDRTLPLLFLQPLSFEELHYHKILTAAKVCLPVNIALSVNFFFGFIMGRNWLEFVVSLGSLVMVFFIGLNIINRNVVRNFYRGIWSSIIKLVIATILALCIFIFVNLVIHIIINELVGPFSQFWERLTYILGNFMVLVWITFWTYRIYASSTKRQVFLAVFKS
jgi:hypothetical protein